MSQNEQLIWALQEHDRKNPTIEIVPQTPCRSIHAIHELEREERERLAQVREEIERIRDSHQVPETDIPVIGEGEPFPYWRQTQDPYKSREQIANEKRKGTTGILSVIRKKRGFADIFAEKEGKR